MKTFLLGFVVAIVVIVAGGYLYLAMGRAPVAVKAAPLPFERTITHMALNATIRRAGNATPPIPASEENFAAGARVYRANCALCHGLPGQKASAIAQGEFPDPPDLLNRKGVSNDPPGETYWKVANGIRLSGMPGFTGSLSTDQMWQVSLMLANSDKLPGAVKEILRKPLTIE